MTGVQAKHDGGLTRILQYTLEKGRDLRYIMEVESKRFTHRLFLHISENENNQC